MRIDAKGLLRHPWIEKMVITDPFGELPEEVSNTVKMHIDS